MSVSIRLKQHLDREGVEYEHRVHPTAYTSQEIAAAAHIPGREMAKTVILKGDDKLLMAVLCANDKVDIEALQRKTGAKTLRLATEEEFRTAFPTCEVGAMPPFGNLFGLQTYCDSALERDDRIEFNAGTHHDTVRLRFADFKRVVNPEVVDLTVRPLRLVV